MIINIRKLIYYRKEKGKIREYHNLLTILTLLGLFIILSCFIYWFLCICFICFICFTKDRTIPFFLAFYCPIVKFLLLFLLRFKLRLRWRLFILFLLGEILNFIGGGLDQQSIEHFIP